MYSKYKLIRYFLQVQEKFIPNILHTMGPVNKRKYKKITYVSLYVPDNVETAPSNVGNVLPLGYNEDGCLLLVEPHG
jgi:hypothetical protein